MQEYRGCIVFNQWLTILATRIPYIHVSVLAFINTTLGEKKIVVGRKIASNFSATHLGAVELSKLILVAMPELN